jgi:hypothetical protein
MQIRKVRERRWMWMKCEMKWVKWYRILNKWWEGKKKLNFKFGKTLGTEKVGKEPFLKPFSSQPV